MYTTPSAVDYVKRNSVELWKMTLLNQNINMDVIFK